MCAVFGYVARGRSTVDVSRLALIAAANVVRGPHAFGFAWVDADGRLRCYKQSGRITDSIGLLAMTRGAVMVIGHVRYATHGSPGDNTNNHPHPIDGGWLVHNGVVGNYEELLDSRHLCPVSQCDSEAIALMHESAGGDFLSRTAEATEAVRGNLVTLSLWNRPGRLIACRRGNPLHRGDSVDGIYLATLPDELPGKVKAMTNGQAVEFIRPNKGGIRERVQKVAGVEGRYVPSHTGASLFSGRKGGADEYIGG